MINPVASPVHKRKDILCECVCDVINQSTVTRLHKRDMFISTSLHITLKLSFHIYVIFLCHSLCFSTHTHTRRHRYYLFFTLYTDVCTLYIIHQLFQVKHSAVIYFSTLKGIPVLFFYQQVQIHTFLNCSF